MSNIQQEGVGYNMRVGSFGIKVGVIRTNVLNKIVTSYSTNKHHTIYYSISTNLKWNLVFSTLS